MRRNWNEPEPPENMEYRADSLPPEENAPGVPDEYEQPYPDGEALYDDEAGQEQYPYEADAEELPEEYIPDEQAPYVSAENAGFASEWLGEEMYTEEEEQPAKHTIFKPRTRKPSFILAVAVNSFRTLILMVLIFMLAGLGAGVYGTPEETARSWRKDLEFTPRMDEATRRLEMDGWHRAVERSLGWAKG